MLTDRTHKFHPRDSADLQVIRHQTLTRTGKTRKLWPETMLVQFGRAAALRAFEGLEPVGAGSRFNPDDAVGHAFEAARCFRRAN